MKLEKFIENLFFPTNVVLFAAIILILYLINTSYLFNHFIIFLISLLIFLIVFRFSKDIKSETKRYSYASSFSLIVFIILLYFIPVSKEFLFAGLTVLITNFIIHFVRDVWKISAHTLVYTVFCTTFTIINLNFVFLFVFLPLVFWSRLRLKRHDWSQVFVAFIIGIVIPFVIDYILNIR